MEIKQIIQRADNKGKVFIETEDCLYSFDTKQEAEGFIKKNKGV